MSRVVEPTAAAAGLNNPDSVSSSNSEVAAAAAAAAGRFRCSIACWKSMAKDYLHRVRTYLLEIEMGVVWGVAGVSIVAFVFAAIWYIDPALLTLVLQFRQAKCKTENSTTLSGISNCTWTSCKVGCTRDVYHCWQIYVKFDFVSGTRPYQPPWGSLMSSSESDMATSNPVGLARLYPNVRGCGYPPELNCDDFFALFGPKDAKFDCWVSTVDTTVALTELNLERAKEEVIFSLLPLFIFILFVMYAFCRLGVFNICNPVTVFCPKSLDSRKRVDMSGLSPRKLFAYKRAMMAKQQGKQANEGSAVVQSKRQQQQQSIVAVEAPRSAIEEAYPSESALEETDEMLETSGRRRHFARFQSSADDELSSSEQEVTALVVKTEEEETDAEDPQQPCLNDSFRNAMLDLITFDKTDQGTEEQQKDSKKGKKKMINKRLAFGKKNS